ncbi:lycopene cyclase domain-containing protein [Mangrovimonas sp. CR14]|uniref:lycopene cyclase domain-containing protein n=1 Tax=Mangrovimonas sp. CR14 TaxID=2706120 RepID=UPI00141D8B5A|nr:lycopene cyclase domain-containing protein [Mangrovimonas sp. CR14]NIK92941.1 lycopene cyclase domain-containing protein [Mangrovimonas sp. CR14]
MNYLYLLLDLGSLSIPFLFSFHPKLAFTKQWKPLFFGIFCSMVLYIPWDILFTQNEIWGFNSSYFLNIPLLSIPIEEWLFFICIPYACVFMHHSLMILFPKLKLEIKQVKVITGFLLTILIILCFMYYDKWYTLVNNVYAILLLLVTIKWFPKILNTYFWTFMVMLIPFFIINGILTGSLIEDEVVWYNNLENLGIRLWTIPIEDSIYAFSLILSNLFFMEIYKRLFGKQVID